MRDADEGEHEEAEEEQSGHHGCRDRPAAKAVDECGPGLRGVRRDGGGCTDAERDMLRSRELLDAQGKITLNEQAQPLETLEQVLRDKLAAKLNAAPAPQGKPDQVFGASPSACLTPPPT